MWPQNSHSNVRKIFNGQTLSYYAVAHIKRVTLFLSLQKTHLA